MIESAPMNDFPMCDDCVNMGLYNLHMEQIRLAALPDPVFGCKGHQRIYNYTIGYRSESGNNPRDLPCQCQQANMYIATAKSGEITLKCPICKTTAITPVPDR